MNIGRIVVGIIVFIFGVIVVFPSILFIIPVLLVDEMWGLAIMFVGLFILFNKNEDTIEEIHNHNNHTDHEKIDRDHWE